MTAIKVSARISMDEGIFVFKVVLRWLGKFLRLAESGDGFFHPGKPGFDRVYPAFT